MFLQGMGSFGALLGEVFGCGLLWFRDGCEFIGYWNGTSVGLPEMRAQGVTALFYR